MNKNIILLKGENVKIEDMILDYLYLLTEKEYEGIELTEHESKGYVAIAEYCNKNVIPIEFSIEL